MADGRRNRSVAETQGIFVAFVRIFALYRIAVPTGTAPGQPIGSHFVIPENETMLV